MKCVSLALAPAVLMLVLAGCQATEDVAALVTGEQERALPPPTNPALTMPANTSELPEPRRGGQGGTIAPQARDILLRSGEGVPARDRNVAGATRNGETRGANQ